MAVRIMDSTTTLDHTTYEMLNSSWLSKSRSATEIVAGSRNEPAIFKGLPSYSYIECRLFESKVNAHFSGLQMRLLKKEDITER
jgi:hypothetical protein